MDQGQAPEPTAKITGTSLQQASALPPHPVLQYLGLLPPSSTAGAAGIATLGHSLAQGHEAVTALQLGLVSKPMHAMGMRHAAYHMQQAWLNACSCSLHPHSSAPR